MWNKDKWFSVDVSLEFHANDFFFLAKLQKNFIKENGLKNIPQKNSSQRGPKEDVAFFI